MQQERHRTESSRLLFLDFDGVVCDSLDECLVSSWVAYHRTHGSEPPPSVPRELRERFSLLRPYIRSGEDYLLIHELIEKGVTDCTQAAFDAAIRQRGPERMRAYRKRFYEAREWLLQTMPEYWYTLNRIYPHMRAALANMQAESPVYILSTKRPDFISRILAGLRPPVHLPDEKILYGGVPLHDATSPRQSNGDPAGSIGKLGIISRVLDTTGAAEALFVDDQPEHFVPCHDARIACRLASWGYVTPLTLAEARRAESYRIIEPEEMARLLRAFIPPAEAGHPSTS